ncbi:MAG: L-threonylcarbamoyladenylate synthase [Candidatus Paceibacterota bacterium]|jgi:L-threonylcarbamoyladenylate synthase
MLNQKEKKIIEIIKKDGIGVMPTDTLYGLIGSAFSEKAINRIYKLKKRSKKKKLIILISSLKDLEKFKIKINKKQAKILKEFWPGKVSIILNEIAFRLPKNKKLLEILKKTGPLVAPSANPEGLKPAENIKQAKNYFGHKVDFYLSGENLKSKPSILIEINKNSEIKVLRGKIKL